MIASVASLVFLLSFLSRSIPICHDLDYLQLCSSYSLFHAILLIPALANSFKPLHMVEQEHFFSVFLTFAHLFSWSESKSSSTEKLEIHFRDRHKTLNMRVMIDLIQF